MNQQHSSTTVVSMKEKNKQRLAALQTKVSTGNLAMLERNQLMAEMFAGGDSQPEIVDVVNAAADRCGDKPITAGAVHNAIKRVKAKR